jgi:hypothetical protein
MLEYVRSVEELCKKKEKESHYRPWQVLRVPGGWGAQILRQPVHKSGKVVSPTHRPPLPPECIHGTHFCYRLSRAQGHSAAGRIMSMKNSSVTPTGIHPATFRFLAQCLNHCATAFPRYVRKGSWISIFNDFVSRTNGNGHELQSYHKTWVFLELVLPNCH